MLEAESAVLVARGLAVFVGNRDARRLSAEMRRSLDVPDRDTVPDLPAEEYFTSNADALKLYARANDLLLIDSNFATALELLQQAVAADPTFTLAQYTLSTLLLVSNRRAEAAAPIQAALTNVYRLPERAQFVVKSDYYFITQDVDKAWAVVEMWAEIYPEDLLALQSLFTVQNARNQRTEAIATLEKIYAINSGRADVLKQIAQLQSSLGNFAEARDALQLYIDRFPDDYTGLSGLANIELNIGELDAARKNIDKAQLLEPTNTDLMIMSARLHHRIGDFAAAESGFKAALAGAASPSARIDAWAALFNYYRLQGQTTPAFDALARRFEESRAVVPPMQLAALRLANLDVYLETGREAEARAILDEYAGELPVPLNIVKGVAELRLALENRDIAAAETQLAAVESLITQSGLENFRNSALSARAELAGLKGEWAQAQELRQQFLRANPTDPLVHTAIAECLRELGRLDEAEQAVRTTLARIPGGATANVELARILQARGDVEGARAQLDRALEVWSLAEPDFEPAAEARLQLASIP
jgi:tetratricopeptide (TPR) repeat protein